MSDETDKDSIRFFKGPVDKRVSEKSAAQNDSRGIQEAMAQLSQLKTLLGHKEAEDTPFETSEGTFAADDVDVSPQDALHPGDDDGDPEASAAVAEAADALDARHAPNGGQDDLPGDDVNADIDAMQDAADTGPVSAAPDENGLEAPDVLSVLPEDDEDDLAPAVSEAPSGADSAGVAAGTEDDDPLDVFAEDEDIVELDRVMPVSGAEADQKEDGPPLYDIFAETGQETQAQPASQASGGEDRDGSASPFRGVIDRITAPSARHEDTSSPRLDDADELADADIGPASTGQTASDASDGLPEPSPFGGDDMLDDAAALDALEDDSGDDPDDADQDEGLSWFDDAAVGGDPEDDLPDEVAHEDDTQTDFAIDADTPAFDGSAAMTGDVTPETAQKPEMTREEAIAALMANEPDDASRASEATVNEMPADEARETGNGTASVDDVADQAPSDATPIVADRKRTGQAPGRSRRILRGALATAAAITLAAGIGTGGYLYLATHSPGLLSRIADGFAGPTETASGNAGDYRPGQAAGDGAGLPAPAVSGLDEAEAPDEASPVSGGSGRDVADASAEPRPDRVEIATPNRGDAAIDDIPDFVLDRNGQILVAIDGDTSNLRWSRPEETLSLSDAEIERNIVAQEGVDGYDLPEDIQRIAFPTDMQDQAWGTPAGPDPAAREADDRDVFIPQSDGVESLRVDLTEDWDPTAGQTGPTPAEEIDTTARDLRRERETGDEVAGNPSDPGADVALSVGETAPREEPDTTTTEKGAADEAERVASMTDAEIAEFADMIIATGGASADERQVIINRMKRRREEILEAREARIRAEAEARRAAMMQAAERIVRERAFMERSLALDTRVAEFLEGPVAAPAETIDTTPLELLTRMDFADTLDFETVIANARARAEEEARRLAAQQRAEEAAEAEAQAAAADDPDAAAVRELSEEIASLGQDADARTEIEERINEVVTLLGDLGGAVDTVASRLSALETAGEQRALRIDAIERSVRSAAAIIPELAEVQESLEKTQVVVVDMASRVTELETTNPADRQSVNAALSDFERQIQSLKASLAVVARMAVQNLAQPEAAGTSSANTGVVTSNAERPRADIDTVYRDPDETDGFEIVSNAGSAIPADVAEGDVIPQYGRVLDIMQAADGQRLVVMENGSALIPG